VRLLIIAFLIFHPLALQTAAALGAQASLPADFRQGPTDLSKRAEMPALPGEFQRPWDDPKTALVIDPYHANPIEWDKLKTDPRVLAIIHKATIGASKIDPAYFTRKEEARKRGYLWGSYHWGVSGNPEEQADYYLDTVKPGDDELIALDLEDAASKKLMNAEESLRFIKRVKERTGRYPLLYTNHKSAKLLSAKFKGTEFAEAPLWYARFESAVTDFPSGLWRSYTLWQFSSEIRSQMTLPGVKPDMDVNVYNGTADDLKSNWPLTRSIRLNGR
jgi:lysozyme